MFILTFMESLQNQEFTVSPDGKQTAFLQQGKLRGSHLRVDFTAWLNLHVLPRKRVPVKPGSSKGLSAAHRAGSLQRTAVSCFLPAGTIEAP